MPRQEHDPVDFRLGLNYEQRDRMLTLRLRREQLKERIAGYRKDGNPSFLQAELGALSWAIRIIENAAMAGALDELE